MNHNEYWERFEQTGAIIDYLNYTACTSESEDQNIIEEEHLSLKKDCNSEENSRKQM